MTFCQLGYGAQYTVNFEFTYPAQGLFSTLKQSKIITDFHHGKNSWSENNPINPLWDWSVLRNWTELWCCCNELKGRAILTHLAMCYFRGKGCSRIHYFMQFSSTHLSICQSRNSHASGFVDSGLKQLKLLFKKDLVHKISEFKIK